jgi:hypothetical protein
VDDRGSNSIIRLNKRDVERLLADYDEDPLGALTTALRIMLEQPDAAWPALIAAAPVTAGRRQLLLDKDQQALDALVAELNELRGLGEHPTSMPASRRAGGGGSARSSGTQSR